VSRFPSWVAAGTFVRAKEGTLRSTITSVDRREDRVLHEDLNGREWETTVALFVARYELDTARLKLDGVRHPEPHRSSSSILEEAGAADT
jgi:hypothetical protein